MSVATVLFFGRVADVVGTRRDVIDADTVDALLAGATSRYGPEFTKVLRICRVWVNGEEVERSSAIVDADEVALLPPMSGGCA